MNGVKYRERRRGQSLVEILIAIAIGTLMITAVATILAVALRTNSNAGQAQVATALGRQLLDNVRVWSEASWLNVANLTMGSSTHYYLSTTTSPFTLIVGPPDEQVVISTSTYTRYFYVERVNRDVNGFIASGAGTTDDPSTKRITVAYSGPRFATRTMQMYITRYRNYVIDQTDWSGGPNQAGTTTVPNDRFATATPNIDYTTTTGSIQLKFN